ncbi:glutathione-dependent formaldehyde-activating enzyme family protein [Burkholderia pseudomallei]|nr:glutathione-dependent formaldehyde-activating enzyme family protein [Burkholderia pseudomallei]KGV20342.1 glutathione-dependent formaldehyde-activating enzyme family protein [Burkholderia pseudomallei TSV 43]KGV43478.1 glutathione-dependent formaldehyde-activating enzyme family protein [Burkholderia pseudomallei TSV 31]KGX66069.1 glutathione-dependent formaldehyde-activating enzyme family protein [Burkholderia pseudomallei TSV5]KGX71809.1 glutathione-dependent formaldehyde-activating enzyme 
MQTDDTPIYEGGCTCGAVRYRMTSRPLIVHCCHCRWCQRETGTAFALNALIESDRLLLLRGEVDIVDTPSNSGKGQKIARCPRCRIAVWSHYAGGGGAVSFVRVGTLDAPERLSPDIHIFTSSKQPWVILPPHAPCPSITRPTKSGRPRASRGAPRCGRSGIVSGGARRARDGRPRATCDVRRVPHAPRSEQAPAPRDGRPDVRAARTHGHFASAR